MISSEAHDVQRIKNPAEFKTGFGGFERDKTACQNSVFLFGGLTLFIEKEPVNHKLPHSFIGSASLRPALEQRLSEAG